jgi:hypothetical protein
MKPPDAPNRANREAQQSLPRRGPRVRQSRPSLDRARGWRLMPETRSGFLCIGCFQYHAPPARRVRALKRSFGPATTWSKFRFDGPWMLLSEWIGSNPSDNQVSTIPQGPNWPNLGATSKPGRRSRKAPCVAGSNARTVNCITRSLLKECFTHGSADSQARRKRKPQHRKDGATKMLKQMLRQCLEQCPAMPRGREREREGRKKLLSHFVRQATAKPPRRQSNNLRSALTRRLMRFPRSTT